MDSLHTYSEWYNLKNHMKEEVNSRPVKNFEMRRMHEAQDKAETAWSDFKEKINSAKKRD